jgi:integrase/recombinase XerD
MGGCAMPLKLVQRKAASNWYIRGTVRGQGIYESTGTGNREVADQIRIKLEERLLTESVFGKRATITFAEAADAFIAAGGSPRFIFEINNQGWSRGLAVELRGRKLAEITQPEIDKLARKLYPRALPATLVRQFYSPFRAVWNFAVRQDWATVRTWDIPHKPKSTNAPQQRRRAGSYPVPYEHAASFIAALSPAPAMTMTALFFTGMRPIELFALEADDLDLERRWIVIRSSKTGEPRGVPMHEFLAPLFASLLKRGGKVFRTHDGKPYAVLENAGGQLKNPLRGAQARSGITDVSPYTARHTVSTQLVINGVHQYVKDQILGHAVNDMSRRYTNIPQKPLIEAINTIEVPDSWRALEWWQDPLAWSGKLAGEQGRRTDLERKRLDPGN